MAKNGSGRVLSFTRAATTVVGTLASCHPCGLKATVEIISPLDSTCAEDCSVQSSRRTSFSLDVLWLNGLEALGLAAERQGTRIAITKICAKKRRRKASCFEGFILLCLRMYSADSDRTDMDITSITAFQWNRVRTVQTPTTVCVPPYFWKTESREITPSSRRESARLTTGTRG